MNSQYEEQKKMLKFQMEEAKWLDSLVRPLLPGFWIRLVESQKENRIGRTLHFLTDVVYIDHIIGLKVARNQDTQVLGGKGFRPGIDHGYRITRVHTTVTRKGKEFAKKTFDLNILIKNNY